MRLICFRSNVLGTKFTVYDGGENPEKKPFIKECESVRQELAAICYVSPYFLCALSIPLYSLESDETCNATGFHVSGDECAGIQRSQENDGDHPWHVGERWKSVHLPKKRMFDE